MRKNNKHLHSIIAADIDGTLLQNGMKELDPTLLPYIDRYVDAGGIFVPASGRQCPDLRDLFGNVADKLSYISENGCQVSHKGKMVCNISLEKDLVHEAIEAIYEIDGAEVRVSDGQARYACPKGEIYREYTSRRVFTGRYHVFDNVTEVSKISENLQVSMVSAFCEEDSAPVCEILRKRFEGRASVAAGGQHWVDVLTMGINKGTGLSDLVEYLGEDYDNVSAMGDYNNDIPILKLAGFPACVGNAIDEVKALCRLEMESGSDLLKYLIDEFLNNC